jgi:hypothetical protein
MDMVKKTVSLTKRSTSAPAADMTGAHPDMVKRVGKVQFALNKIGLDDIDAEVVVLVDRSGSMAGRDREVQLLLERVLAFGLQVDSDGVIPVIPFSSTMHRHFDVTMMNYQEAAANTGAPGGGTIMSDPLLAARDLARDSEKPIFLVVIGDGNPNDPRGTTAAVCELSNYPVFIKFISLAQVDYLDELDNLETTRPGARLLDNVDAQDVPDPAGISDLDFFQKMVEEWDTWIVAAQHHGLLTV